MPKAMFACVILWGMDPLAGLLVGGLVAMALSVPVAFFAFRLPGQVAFLDGVSKL